MSDQLHPSPLDKRLPTPGGFGIAALLVLGVAAFLRLFRLDVYLLNVRESAWAYDAWSMYEGRPLPLGQELPESGPFMLVWNAISFFLFGVTDATARVGSVVLGVGLIGIFFLLRPFLSKTQIISIAGILALSPTMVFSSRTIEPGIAAAFFAVLVLIALLRCGITEKNNHGWAIMLGIALSGLYATGPLGVTTLLALGFGILAAARYDLTRNRPIGAVGIAVKRIGNDRSMLSWMLGSLVISLLVLFTRAFSSLGSLAGLGTTISDWASMMTSGVGTVPTMFYFWSMMLYETIAVVIALVTAAMSRGRSMRAEVAEREVAPLLYVVWFAAALLMFTFASTRDASSTVLVVLPMLLLAGTGLGRLFEAVREITNLRTLLATVGAVVLVAYSVNATIGLAYTRGESGSEPLAHDVPSEQTSDFLDQVMRLSRDISVDQASRLDPTGYYGLTILATPEYEWPFTWYFRDFPNFDVKPAGSITAETDVAIAANPEVMDSVGLTSSNLVWINKPGDPLTMMRSGDIIRTGLNPANWRSAWNYMIHRESDRHENPRTLTIGYSVRLMNKLTTETGPYDLFASSSPGPGSGLGQLDLPAGIAVGHDGTIYVLNAGNARIDRFNPRGEIIGIWSGQVDSALQLSWNGSQGGTGLHVGPDGLIYIADTWNHAVVVVNPNSTVVRVLGNTGVQADITDEGNPLDQPGLFFGPRDIAVTDDKIYVTDTGNERVQVFSKDGTFISAFGGYGEDDGQFIEPTGIAVGPNGDIWVADSGNARLQVFDADGNWLESHHIEQWVGQIGVTRLNMLAFDDNGVMYFSTPDQGVFAWYMGEIVPVDSGLSGVRPGGIAIDQDGKVLVTLTGEAEVVRMEPVPLSQFGVPEASPAASPQATPEG